MDIQPNVRRDGREIVFASNRGGATAFGGQDIWVATREQIGN
jgi:Tol biopolymer transport system component